MLVEYQLIIRNAADSANALEVTSVRGGTNPYISAAPNGDGASIDPRTGVVTAGVMTGRIVDPVTSGTSRLFTSQLEDADFRQQLGHRKAFWKFREDGGAWTTLAAGRLTKARLVSGIEWEIAVGDWMAAEHAATLFEPDEDMPLVGEDSFLEQFPHRGCIAGGPIMGEPIEGSALLGHADLGGWVMRVKEISNDGGDYYVYQLEPVRVYGPGAWTPGSNIFAGPTDGAGNSRDSAAAIINRAVRSLPMKATGVTPTAFNTVAHAMAPTLGWIGLVAIVDDVAYRPVPASIAGRHYPESHLDFLSDVGGPGAMFIVREESDQPLLAAGAWVTVRVLTINPSKLSPIYFDEHPVDFLADALTATGIPYSSSALETVRDALGGSMRLALQVTQPEECGAFLEKAIYGPLGVGTRSNSSGQIEAFPSRILTNDTTALTEITEGDVEQGSVGAFDLDAGAAVRKLIFEHVQYVFSLKLDDGLSAVLETQQRFERTNADPGSIGTGELGYSVPGMIHFHRSGPDISLAQWVDARAHEVFDRWGRGGIRARALLLRGEAGDGTVIGDELLINLPQVPNHNKRLGDDSSVAARAMQVIHATPRLKGIEVELEDSGPNAQPVATVPTHTIALSTDHPRNIAELTITNAATLNAIPAGVEVQIAVVAAGASAPAVEDYTTVLLYSPGEVPTGAIRLPAVFADSDVYARARSIQVGRRPSNWQTAVDTTVDVLEPPENLAATPEATDGSYVDIDFDIGTGSENAATDVYIRESADGADANELVATLAPGSIEHRIYDLEDATEYVVTVRHRDEATGDVSDSDTATVTTGGTVATLSAPTNPDAFSFPLGPPARVQGRGFGGPTQRRARYGIAVVATEIPSFVEIAEAVEDSPGAGTYGAYATIGREEAVSGDWTIWMGYAANDGLRRKLKARHVRDGTTESAYTSEITVALGTYDPVEPFPFLPAQAPSTDVVAVPGTTSYQFNYSVTSGATFEYAIDGGAYASVPASGFTISRNVYGGAAKSVSFKITKNNFSYTQEFPVPAQALGTIGLSLHQGEASPGGGPYTTLDMEWTATGMPTGTTYNAGYDNGDGNVDSATGIATTTKQFTGVTFNGSPGSGALFVDAIYNGQVIASAKRHGPYVG